MRAVAASFVHVLAAVLVGLALAPALVAGVSYTFFSMWPVMHEWTPERVWVEGRDLYLAGTVRKRWQCDYVPPPRAADEAGVFLRVTSANPTAGQQWPTGVARRHFGPWRVEGGAGHVVRFQQHSECLGFLDTFSDLGVVDARGLQ